MHVGLHAAALRGWAFHPSFCSSALPPPLFRAKGWAPRAQHIAIAAHVMYALSRCLTEPQVGLDCVPLCRGL